MHDGMVSDLSEIMAHINPVEDQDLGVIVAKCKAAEAWICEFIGRDLSEFEELPHPIREAIKQLTAHLYENREATIVGMSMEEISPGMFDLLAPYREFVF